MMTKPPKNFCIESFIYKEFESDGWNGPVYKKGVLVEHCRIDRGSQYSSTTSGKQLLYNALIFCYEGITTPMPEFKEQSILVIDGKEHKVTKVIPIYEAYQPILYSYELEVV